MHCRTIIFLKSRDEVVRFLLCKLSICDSLRVTIYHQLSLIATTSSWPNKTRKMSSLHKKTAPNRPKHIQTYTNIYKKKKIDTNSSAANLKMVCITWKDNTKIPVLEEARSGPWLWRTITKKATARLLSVNTVYCSILLPNYQNFWEI